MHPLLLVKPAFSPPLDPDFRPAVLGNRAFHREVRASGAGQPLVIGIERMDGAWNVHRTRVLPPGHPACESNLPFAERLIKCLLWQWGGFRVVVGGPREIGESLRRAYAPGGARSFDAALMSDVYDRPFVVESTLPEAVPEGGEGDPRPRGGELDGCRIGFDAGASDHKVAAVVDGEVVFSEEVPWLPSREADPQYHIDAIRGAFRSAASKMPRVDAIGVSAAGVYVNCEVKVASLFRAVPRDLFQKRVRPLFLELQKEWGGVPMDVANDGDVAALAGSMSLKATRVLGVALGSSEAGGYVSAGGGLTTWLNELAFPPVDFRPDAAIDEWSRDRGCGGEYFSQKAAIRLAPRAGIALDPAQTPAQQLASIQALLAGGHEGARRVFETVGDYLGYGLAHYADFYALEHVMLMGRVVSGEGGNIVLARAKRVLEGEFPEVAETIRVQLPDEKSRRVGQAVAAASLPWISRTARKEASA